MVFLRFYINNKLHCFQMFYVVVADQWCNTAPLSWVDKNKKLCWWPRKNASKAITKMIKPDDTWECYKLKYILGPYRKYTKSKS